MPSSNDKSESTKNGIMRRFASFMGGFGVLTSRLVDGGSRSTDSTGGVQLGDFETGLDGWTTNGGNELERVSEDDIPVGVTNGQRALAVQINGDLFPMIENKKRVKNADFLEHPHLQAHTIGLAEETDSGLLFQFRLHHTPSRSEDGGDSSGRKKGKDRERTPGSKDVDVEESEFKAVPQLTPRTIEWDMSDLSEETLKRATRLEIVWYLEDYEPEGGPRGLSNGDFDYQGLVVFDDIRLDKAPSVSQAQKPQRKRRHLQREHGMIVNRDIEEKSENLERGVFVFADGTEVSYEFEALDDGRIRYTIDGEAFEFESGADG